MFKIRQAQPKSLNTSQRTRPSISQPPNPCTLYQSNLLLSHENKQLWLQNEKLTTKNFNLDKQLTIMNASFQHLHKMLLQQAPSQTLHSRSFYERKYKLKNQKQRLSSWQEQLSKVKKQIREAKLSGLEQECEALEELNIEKASEIEALEIEARILRGEGWDWQAEGLGEGVWGIDEGVVEGKGIREIKQTREEYRTNLDICRKQADNLKKLIAVQNQKFAALSQRKINLKQFVQQYNTVCKQIYSQSKLDETLNKQIQQLVCQIRKMDLQLESQYQSNQQLKSRLFDKQDQEVKQTKNLREEIEKCSQQCRQIKSRYMMALDRNCSKQDRYGIS